MYPQSPKTPMTVLSLEPTPITMNLLGPLSPTTVEFYQAVLNACHDIGTPWVSEPHPQKKAILETVLTQIRTVFNQATSVLESYENVRLLSERLPTTFLWYVSPASPKGRIQAVLNRFPKEMLWLAALQDSRQDTHDCREELNVLREKQEKQAKLLKEMEPYQQLIQELRTENQELKIQLHEMEKGLLEVETELDEVTEENKQLKDKLHEMEQKALLEQRILTPSEEKMLEFITTIQRLQHENSLLKKMQASTELLSKSAPATMAQPHRFLNHNPRTTPKLGSTSHFEAEKRAYKTPSAVFS